MLIPSWMTTPATIIVFAITLVAGMLALFQYLPRVIAWLKRFEDFGIDVKELKDRWLNQWIGLIPMSADTMSVLQVVFIGIALNAYHDHRYHFAGVAFIIGSMMDVLDGGKARHEAKVRGHPSSYGHVLDPTKDIICFLLMVWVLWDKFPRYLMVAFTFAIGIRALYGGLLLARKFWTSMPPLRMMPESVAGKFKSVFAAVAFGLAITWPHSPSAGSWAVRTLWFATALEFTSLAQQAFRAIWPKRVAPPAVDNIVPLRRTGNE